MAGPNLEVFKFAIYVFFPVLVFMHYGDPQWYDRNVLPYKERIFPSEERTTRTLPTDQASVREELERIKARKAARRAEKEGTAGHASETNVTEKEAFERLV